MKISSRNLSLPGIVILSCCVLVIGFFSIRLWQQVNETQEEELRAKQVLLQTQKVQVGIIYNESNTKSYVINPDGIQAEQLQYIPHYVQTELDKLCNLVKDASSQKTNADSLSYYIGKRIELSNQLVSVRKNWGFDSAIQLIKASRNNSNYISATRSFSNRIQNNEDLLLLKEDSARKKAFTSFNLALFTILTILIILTIVMVRQWATNRRQHEQNESESRGFAQLLQNISDAVISTDTQFRVTSWNKVAERLYGFTESTNGMDVAVAVRSTLTKEQSEDYRKEILLNGKCCGEVTHFNAAGEGRIVSFAINPILDNKKEISGFVTIIHDITEQKRSEQLLREFNEQLAQQVSEKTAEIKKSQERFNLIAYATNDAVWDWDMEQDSIWGNESFNQYYGINSQKPAVNYQQFNERVHPDDRYRINSNMLAALERKEEKLFEEFRFKLDDGSYRNILDRCYIKYDDKGKPVRMLGAMMDITERKVTEEKLRQNEERLRGIFNNEPECVKIVDISGLLLEMNPAGLRMIEADDPAKIIGNDVLCLVHPEDRDIYMNLHNSVCRGGSGMATFRIFSLNQKQLWMETHSVPLRDAEGDIYAVLSVTREITEKKLSEIAARKSEEVRKAIMNAALDAIICTDTDGNISLWNPQAEKIFGWKEEEVMGKSMSAHIIPERYRQRHEAGMKRYLQTGQTVMLNKLFEIKALNKAQEEFHIELTIVPVKQDDKEFFCAFIRDISHRREIEEKAKQSEANLKTIFENTLEGFVLTDRDCVIKSFNLTARKSIFQNMGAVIEVGANLLDSIPDEFRRNFLKAMLARVQAGESIQYDRSYIQASGQNVWISYSMNPVMENGHVTGICMAGRDITERKEAEELVLANEKRFRSLVENSTDAVSILAAEVAGDWFSWFL